MASSTKKAVLDVRVAPRARRDEIVEIMADGAVKIRLTAPPVEGRANQALIKFLSDLLEVPKGDIEILAGRTARTKRIAIHGLDTQSAQARLRAHLGG